MLISNVANSSQETKTWSGHANILALKMPAALASLSHCCEWASMWLGSSMIHLALQELLTHEFHPHSSKAFPLVCQHSVNCFLTFHLLLGHQVILCTPGRFHPLCFQVVHPVSRVNLHLVGLEVPYVSICPALRGQTTKAIAQGSKQGVGVTCTRQKASLLCSRSSPTTTTLPPKLAWLPQSS